MKIITSVRIVVEEKNMVTTELRLQFGILRLTNWSFLNPSVKKKVAPTRFV